MTTKKEKAALVALYRKAEETLVTENTGRFYAGYTAGLVEALEIIGVGWQERYEIWEAARNGAGAFLPEAA